MGPDSRCTPAAWVRLGREGHEVVALIAELERAKAILGGTSLEEVASCADEYRRDHRETGPWHYINIPLADSKIDMARECPNGECVIGKAEQFSRRPERPQG